MQLREERQRRPEREPAVEVLAVARGSGSAKPSTATSASSARNDERDGQLERARAAGPVEQAERWRRSRAAAARSRRAPTSSERDSGERAPAGARRSAARARAAPARSASRRARGSRSPPRPPARPGWTPPSTGATENASVPTPATKKPAASSRSSGRPFDREADAGEDRDDRRREHDGGVEHEPPFGQLVRAPQDRIRQEERRRRPQQGDEQQLADEPGLERVFDASLHVPLIGRRAVCR